MKRFILTVSIFTVISLLTGCDSSGADQVDEEVTEGTSAEKDHCPEEDFSLFYENTIDDLYIPECTEISRESLDSYNHFYAEVVVRNVDWEPIANKYEELYPALEVSWGGNTLDMEGQLPNGKHVRFIISQSMRTDGTEGDHVRIVYSGYGD